MGESECQSGEGGSQGWRIYHILHMLSLTLGNVLGQQQGSSLITESTAYHCKGVFPVPGNRILNERWGVDHHSECLGIKGSLCSEIQFSEKLDTLIPVSGVLKYGVSDIFFLEWNPMLLIWSSVASYLPYCMCRWDASSALTWFHEWPFQYCP